MPENVMTTDQADKPSTDVEGNSEPANHAISSGVANIDDLSQYPPSASYVEQFPIRYARQQQVLGLSLNEGRDATQLIPADLLEKTARPFLPVLTHTGYFEENPDRIRQTLDTIERIMQRPVWPVLCSEELLKTAINQAYQQKSDRTRDVIEKIEINSQTAGQITSNLTGEDLLDTGSKAPAIQLVNMLIFDAVQQSASDIHIQPQDGSLIARLRVDGVLFDASDLPHHMQEEIISRVKVMGHMNIAEKRLPQDGRATVQIGDRLIDLRISAIPSSHGERIVIRLLDKSARLYQLEELGMAKDVQEQFRNLIHLEHGLLLVTGPTGSGKSTTLYSALQEINSTAKNILTLEDPIEYQLDGISQMQVSAKKGMTFAKGLRSVLRQDPDIIMVGEIRDEETAIMAIQSALTGHMVFSTLHTNDAASAITRLLDLGIEPYLVASSLKAVLAQRLVRRVCQVCYNHPVKKLTCTACRQTGFKGRMGLFELLRVNEAIETLIQTQQSAATIKQSAVSDGMRTLQDDGLIRAREGQTTEEEINRVTMNL